MKSIDGISEASISSFNAFFEWYMLPKELRDWDEPDIKSYSAKHNICRRTIYFWMKTQAFKKQFDEFMQKNTLSHTADIIKAMYEAAVSPDGTANDRRLWLEYVEKWNPKAIVEHTGAIDLVAILEARSKKPKQVED